MAYINPSVADFKARFVRDFPFGTDIQSNVLDQDVATAFQLTNMNINQNLWPDQSSYTVAYLLLSAHHMVMTLRASSQGINGQFNFLQGSKGVGSVSESFSIPQRVLDNPSLAILAKTNYGAQYLMLILPKLAGQMFNLYDPTNP